MSKYWPSVTGKVLDSRILVKTNTAIGNKNRYYHPTVTYEFKVKNKNYKSKLLGNFIGFGNDENYAERLIKDFPESSEVKVFYCPYYPGISVIIPGMKQKVANYLLLFTGLITLLGSSPVLFSDYPYWFVDRIWEIVDTEI